MFFQILVQSGIPNWTFSFCLTKNVNFYEQNNLLFVEFLKDFFLTFYGSFFSDSVNPSIKQSNFFPSHLHLLNPHDFRNFFNF